MAHDLQELEPISSPWDDYPKGELFVWTMSNKSNCLEVVGDDQLEIMFRCLICFDAFSLKAVHKIHRCGNCQKIYCEDCAHTIGYTVKKCGACRAPWERYNKRRRLRAGTRIVLN